MSAAMNVWRWSVLGMLCSIAPQALAQTTGAITQFDLDGVAAGTATKSIALHFDGDHYLDVATIVSGNLRIQFAPDVRDLATTIDPAWTVADICALPRRFVGDYRTNAIAIAASDGVHIYGVEESGTIIEFAYSATANPCIAIQWVDKPLFDPGYELVALSPILNSGGTQVGTNALFFNYDNGELSLGSSMTCLNSSGNAIVAKDLRLLRWDSDQNFDLALLRSNGVSILNTSGAQLWTRSPTSANTHAIAMAVVNRSGRSTQYLAWTAYDASVSDLRLRVDGTNNGSDDNQIQFNLGGFEVFDLGSVDLNNDGLLDLLVSNRTGADQGLLINVSGNSAYSGYAFNSTATATYPLATSSAGFSNHNAAPVAGDFDNDGDADIFAICDVHPAMYLIRSSTVDENSLRVSVDNYGVGTYFYARSAFRLKIPYDLLGLADRMEVKVYRADFAGGFQDHLPTGPTIVFESDPVAEAVFELSSIPSDPDLCYHYAESTVAYNFESAPGGSAPPDNWMYIDFPWVAEQTIFQNAEGKGSIFGGSPVPHQDQDYVNCGYYNGLGNYRDLVAGWYAINVQIRLYKLDAEGAVSAIYPARVFTMSTDDYVTSFLEGNAQTTGVEAESFALDVIGTGSSGSQSGTGGTTPQRPVDPYSPPPPIPPPSGP